METLYMCKRSATLIFFLFISITTVAADTKIVEYPGYKPLSIEIPSSWKVLPNKRFDVTSPNSVVHLAGTAFSSKDKNLTQFSNDSFNSVTKQMPWYKRVGDITPLKGQNFEGHQQIYEGIWKGENIPTLYIVNTYHLNSKLLLKASFTLFSKDYEDNKEAINKVIASVKLN